jgi:hypothetical protein
MGEGKHPFATFLTIKGLKLNTLTLQGFGIRFSSLGTAIGLIPWVLGKLPWLSLVFRKIASALLLEWA